MNIHTIGSIKDSVIVLARELTSQVGRERNKKFLLFDHSQISWALQTDIRIDAIICVKYPDFLKNISIPVYKTTEGIMKKITDTSYLIPFKGTVNGKY